MIEGLSAILFGEKYEKPESVNSMELDSKALDSYIGKYRFGPDFYRPGAELNVVNQDSRLSFYWSETYFYPLLALSRDKFLDRRFWAYIIFERNEKGEVTGFIWKDPDEFSAERLPAKKAPLD